MFRFAMIAAVGVFLTSCSGADSSSGGKLLVRLRVEVRARMCRKVTLT